MLRSRIKSAFASHINDKEDIRSRVLERVAHDGATVTRPAPRVRPVIAVCFALLVLAGAGGGIAIAVEAAEYNEAVSYLAEQGISIEGMSRDDVKSLYREILLKTQTFEGTESQEENDDVIILNTVIELEPADTDTLEGYYSIYSNVYHTLDPDGVDYLFSSYYETVTRYIDGEVDWVAPFEYKHGGPSYYGSSTPLFPYKDGVLVIIQYEDGDSGKTRHETYPTAYYFADGEMVWSRMLSDEDPYSYKMMVDGDSFVFFGTVSTEEKCEEFFARIDIATGETLAYNKWFCAGYDRTLARDIDKVGDNYAIYKVSVPEENSSDETTTVSERDLLFISPEGEKLREINLFEQGKQYDSISIKANGDTLFISATTNKYSYSKYMEYFDASGDKSEYVTNYCSDAILLAMDENGTLLHSYTVENAYSSGFTNTENGNTAWLVSSYTGEYGFKGIYNINYDAAFIVSVHEVELDGDGQYVRQRATAKADLPYFDRSLDRIWAFYNNRNLTEDVS